jgi:hypothetical protein
MQAEFLKKRKAASPSKKKRPLWCQWRTKCNRFTANIKQQMINANIFFVEVVGFEPTAYQSDGFTVRCNSTIVAVLPFFFAEAIGIEPIKLLHPAVFKTVSSAIRATSVLCER